MNILVVTETYPPEINGVARTLAQMVEGLSRLGHGITLVRPAQRGPETARAARPGIDTHVVKGLPLPGYPSLQFGAPSRRLFDRLIGEGRIDSAYIATEGPLGYSALRACRRHEVPALSGLHTNFHQYSRHYGAGILAPLLLRYLRGFHNRLAGTLVPTTTMADEMAAVGLERLHVWPRGVDAELFTPDRRSQELRSRWGLKPDELAVLYVGRIAAEKNIETAFKAFVQIQARQPSARFILVGEGPIESRLRDAYPDAVFAGSKTGEELAEYYASGDIFLFPSLTETFGNVTLEALASGMAVVSFDLAAAHELIRHGHNGLLARDEQTEHFIEQAVACAQHAQLRAQLKRHARETGMQQAWPKLISDLEALFLSLNRGSRTDGLESTVEPAE
jgi:glycosyltransferase involved in cell wall biosynthesis